LKAMMGKRPPWYVKYKVGYDEDGKLNGIEFDWYSDPGWIKNGSNINACYWFFDTAYYCPNYLIRNYLVKTNKPASTEVRSPDVFPSMSLIEHVMDHIALKLNCDASLIRQRNFYKKNQLTLMKHKLTYSDIEVVFEQLKTSSNYLQRREQIDEFNKLNMWKKKGIALIPLRYSLTYSLSYYNSLVSIRHHDGSIAISHGGIEMGNVITCFYFSLTSYDFIRVYKTNANRFENSHFILLYILKGIHTKVAQACSYELGVPMEKISVKTTNNQVNPNAVWTGASVTSEHCVKV
jgi:xanthine dehydrogenase molybdopterin-binding subunit B